MRLDLNLNFEEEYLLQEILTDKPLEQVEILLALNELIDNSDHIECINITKSLFKKIKNSTEHEYNEYLINCELR